MKHPAPHTPLLSERGGGAEAGCSKKVVKPEGLGIVEWLARVVPNSRRTKCCPFFRL